PRAPLRVGVEQVPQPTRARLVLELFHDRRVEVRIARLAHLALIHRLDRVDALIHERLHPLQVVLAAISQLEVHDVWLRGSRDGKAGARPSMWLCTPSWTSGRTKDAIISSSAAATA